MLLKTDKMPLTFETENYKLTFIEDAPFVLVEDFAGDKLIKLYYLSSVHSTQGQDDTTKVGTWKVEEESGKVIFTLEADSTIWDKKIYRFICEEERFSYDIKMKGQGKITNADYFGGYYSADVKWGSGFLYSEHNFTQIFNPEPNTFEENYLPPYAGSVIDLMGVNLPAKGDWFFTPPPFCFAFQGKNTLFSVGAEAKPGENKFTEYTYNGRIEGFYLSLSYEGYTDVQGSYRLPALGFDFATDEYEAIKKHVNQLKTLEYVPSITKENKPSWWYQPIACGWGSQCYLANKEGGYAPDYARQELYDGFVKTLEENNINPGIFVIDDKWQKYYGHNEVDEEKWPNLPKFIQAEQAKGRKVLLWLKAWDPEGLPAEECIRNAAGIPVSVDPTNPAFEQRLRKSIRNMLSQDGYNGDGFKIDFTARIPSGPNMVSHANVWGLELMKLYLGIIYDEAKKTKSDALIMTHTPHPYLADVLDMVRLNDINMGTDVNKAMIHRAKIARIACPNAVIDTDNWPITNKQAWSDYTKIQHELGVPSFYFSSHIDSTQEVLTEEDYELVRTSWNKYLARIKE